MRRILLSLTALSLVIPTSFVGLSAPASAHYSKRAHSHYHGRTYYRLQMGTTSQAHSEVLCQRMRVIGQSCIVVGLGQSTGSVK